ncbi:hypothetical protein [Lysinibacillus telephonicus]|uniref:Leucine-rich repeat domain-containing protein n=1 Tax=Lysinibacillus telephonicus TaxID=1714840 RepID=A0A431USD6_9BACI|nr:hypothetical protein [Lysinibacillus telephonicus]RTQ92855.1 hypothetical protein EKG35_10560 [Lysinibacillus telephonicus]
MVFDKVYFDRSFRFININPDIEVIDVEDIKMQEIDSVSVSHDSINHKFESIKNLNGISDIRGLRLNSYNYNSLKDLKNYSSLEYFNFLGKTDEVIPFEELVSLWCVYLNYDKKTCSSIFQNKNIEYLFIDNYSDDSSEKFNIFTNAKRIGLVKTKIIEFEALRYMPFLEHIGIGYNSKMTSLKWIEEGKSLNSIGFQNCKNIKDWSSIGTVSTIEKVIIENCGEIPSLDFLHQLPNLQEVRIIGTTSIKDGKIKHLLNHKTLKYLFLPIKKDYDIKLADLENFNNR